MKGRNEFILSEATMIEAVQQYLDKIMPHHAQTVTSVNTTNDITMCFRIVLEDVDRPYPSEGKP